ncbi:MAG: inositol monophosphatase family protein [bacterium]
MGSAIDTISGIARRAGKILLDHVGRVEHVEYKGAIDLVTEVDRMSEAFIIAELSRAFPGDDILAEESGGTKRGSARRWIVDPLDGTVNFAHGFPFFCVSIALEEDGEIVAAAIFDPNRDELFTAEKGKGAELNGSEMRVSNAAALDKSLVATGFAYNVRQEERLDNLDNFGNFIKRARAVRRPGSAAIDLAWTACGRIDGFWELFLKPWDIAAGVLLIREAGGRVTSFDGGPIDIYGTQILASNGLIHGEMMRVLMKTKEE